MAKAGVVCMSTRLHILLVVDAIRRACVRLNGVRYVTYLDVLASFLRPFNSHFSDRIRPPVVSSVAGDERRQVGSTCTRLDSIHRQGNGASQIPPPPPTAPTTLVLTPRPAEEYATNTKQQGRYSAHNAAAASLQRYRHVSIGPLGQVWQNMTS